MSAEVMGAVAFEKTGENAQRGTRPGSAEWAASAGSFWIGSVLLLAVLLALIPVLDNGYVAAPDGGVYAAQAQNLAEGGWASRRAAPDVDATGENSGLVPDGGIYGDLEIPYARHPLFSLALKPLYEFGAVGGMMLFSVAGVWIASVATGLLARRSDPRLGLPALLMTGLVSPIVFDAHLVSAHGMGTAAAAVVFLGVAQIVDDRRWAPLMWTLPAVAVAVLLRSEASVAMASMAGALGLVGLVRRVRSNVDWMSVVTGILILGTAASAYVIDARWTRSIRGEAGFGRQPLAKVLGEHSGPFDAAWISLLRPYSNSVVEARTPYVVAVVFLACAAVLFRLLPKRPLLPVALVVCAAGGVVWTAFEPAALVSGFLAACPLIPVGIVLLRREHMTAIIVRSLLASAVAATLLILTIYSVGGAFEWGGRFFHILVPLLVPASLVGIGSLFDRMPRQEGRVALAALLVIAAMCPVHALRAQSSVRESNKIAVESLTAFALEQQRGEERPLIVIGKLSASGFSRFFWDRRDEVDVLTPRGPSEVMYLVELAKNAGRTRVVLATGVDEGLLRAMGDRWLERNGWDILGRSTNGPMAYLLGPADADQPTDE